MLWSICCVTGHKAPNAHRLQPCRFKNSEEPSSFADPSRAHAACLCAPGSTLCNPRPRTELLQLVLPCGASSSQLPNHTHSSCRSNQQAMAQLCWPRLQLQLMPASSTGPGTTSLAVPAEPPEHGRHALVQDFKGLMPARQSEAVAGHAARSAGRPRRDVRGHAGNVRPAPRSGARRRRCPCCAL